MTAPRTRLRGIPCDVLLPAPRRRELVLLPGAGQGASVRVGAQGAQRRPGLLAGSVGLLAGSVRTSQADPVLVEIEYLAHAFAGKHESAARAP